MPACNTKFTTKQLHETKGVSPASDTQLGKNGVFYLQNLTGKYLPASILWERHRCYIQVTPRIPVPAHAPMDLRNASATDSL